MSKISKTHRSEALAVIHELMKALNDVSAIDKQAMRRFDDTCLTSVRPLASEESE